VTHTDPTGGQLIAARPVRRLLVANRGEIARRIFWTCRELGIWTVAVYSDPDTDAAFVVEADEAVPIGGAAPAQSYLRADLIVEAALRTGADAVHPGYGFLSENAGFARACAAAGLTFVGPDPGTIELMGSKLAARDLMRQAGVPVLPGVDLTGVATDKLADLADDVGWPVLVKASAGGGGRGMRVVRDPGALAEAVASARREAGSAFGDDTVFLEHYVDRPRHVEIQIFGDRHGTVTHLGERECSIQRRHQKIIEESPSPAVGPQLRARMGAAAAEAGRALGYVGAGTVEFILDPDGGFHFLEVNTRLQVEHPVTELVTGLDLVRLQLEVAAGRPLPPEALTPRLTGHAVEVRLYAEDPLRGYLPTPGRLDRFELAPAAGVRVDAGVSSGEQVPPHYDPMLAKVIAHGATRAEAVARLVRTLRGARIQGVPTNAALLVGILEHPDFAAGTIDTHFLDRLPPAELIRPAGEAFVRAAALVAALTDQARDRAAAKALPTVVSGFRNNPSQARIRRYVVDGRELEVAYRLGRDEGHCVDGEPLQVRVHALAPGHADVVVDGVRRRYTLDRAAGTVHVSTAAGAVQLRVVPRFPETVAHLHQGSLVAPMPATVVRLLVAPGDLVGAGQALVVLEAMKMEHSVLAPDDAAVTEVPVGVGDTVGIGQLLVVLEERADGAKDGLEGTTDGAKDGPA
jgi:propionyl-CoA carboxylase alpha chain